MTAMIADSSAWIELMRASGSPAHLKLRKALASANPPWMPDVVYQELLQGARHAADYVRLQALLDEVPAFKPHDSRELHRHAALLYARCRWKGLTIRSPNDCLVTACALEADLPLLAHDRDFAAIARIESALKLL